MNPIFIVMFTIDIIYWFHILINTLVLCGSVRHSAWNRWNYSIHIIIRGIAVMLKAVRDVFKRILHISPNCLQMLVDHRILDWVNFQCTLLIDLIN